MAQYRKTLADLWCENEVLRALSSSPIANDTGDARDALMDGKYASMTDAVCLDATGIERLLSDALRGEVVSDGESGPDRLTSSEANDDVSGWSWSLFPRAIPPPWRTTLVEVGAPAGRRHGVVIVDATTKEWGTAFAAHAVAHHRPVHDNIPLHALGWTMAHSLMGRLDASGQMEGRCPLVPWRGFAPPDATMAAAFLALSLINTSPSSFRMTEQPPPPRLDKRHAERHGRRLARYRVLEIRTMRESGPGAWEPVEKFVSERALHLRRGHWKDYRRGSGLFGKIKGMWFWEASVAGDVKNGIIAKDYTLKP